MIEIFGAYAGLNATSTGLEKAGVDLTVFQEGEQLRRERTFFSRNPKLREEAIRKHGLNCTVCNFDFATVYGVLGAGYIEMHHLESVSERASKSTSGWSISAEDVRPLCANCHRMVHRRRPPLSLEELSKLIVRAPQVAG